MIFKKPEITEAAAGEKLVVRFRYIDFLLGIKSPFDLC